MSIAIVTDSTADIPLSLLQDHPIAVIPTMLILDGKTYADGEGITREEFYQRLVTSSDLPTTSAPPISLFHQMYEKLLHDGATQVISIHVASAFSGVYGIASAAAQSFKERIHVIDSGSVTFGLGFQVIAAAEAAAAGASTEEIHRVVEQVSQRVHFVALLDTIEHLRRSGRVSWAAATIGSLLNLKVMIEVSKGQVYRLGLFRNRQQGFASLIKQLRGLGRLERLALVYTQLTHPEELSRLQEATREQLASLPFMGPVTTVIGTHVGSNGIGFIAVTA
jgi:DegV family protein with EDD domain